MGRWGGGGGRVTIYSHLQKNADNSCLKPYTNYLLMPGFEGPMLSECCFGKHSSRAIARELCTSQINTLERHSTSKNLALKGLVHHFSRKYCIMTSLYRRCNVFDVILNDKGRNSVEQNAIVHDNSDQALLRPHAPLLQSLNVVNQRISKDISCDALNYFLEHRQESGITDFLFPSNVSGSPEFLLHTVFTV